MKIGYEEEVVMFPFHKRKVKTISMKPPIFGEFYMKVHLLQECTEFISGPFYSCLFSDLAFDGSEAADDFVLIQNSLAFIV